MVIIYNILLTFFIILFAPIIFTRYKFNKINKSYRIWIHCASLGEAKIALKLIKYLVDKFNFAVDNILLTTTTKTAKMFAKKEHNETYIFPIDYFLITRKLIKKIKPKVLIIVETELWPNYIYYAKRYGVKIFIVNGRVTQKTFVFFKIFNFLFRNIFEKIDFVMVREKIDFLRFKNLGFNKDLIKITGNMKYDDIEENISFNISKKDLSFKEEDFIICFGSIREKEEKKIIEKIILKFKDDEKIKFILAPRHMQIIDKIKKLLKKYNIKYELRSFLSNSNFKCLIIDTYGELKKIYSISDIVFVCGTILPYGGQNIIEPASLAKLVVFGKYISNFLEPAKLLLSNNAAIMVNKIEDFVEIIKKFYNEKLLLKIYGEKAKNTVLSLKGVTEKNMEIILNSSKNIL